MIQRATGVLLLVLAVATFGATVLRVPLTDSSRLDLHPKPDADQYLAGAVSLHRHGQFAIELGGQLVPPRYPFGYSLVMVPWLAAGVTPVTVPFLVNGAVGLALIVGLFAVYWRRAPLAAGVSVVLLASWPAFIVASRSPLSEASGGAVALLAFWGLATLASRGSWSAGIVGALLLGVSIWFRIANAFLAPILVLAPLALRVPWGKRVGIGAALVGAFVIGLFPLLWFNYQHFGSPLRTGYSLWVPYWAELGNAFRLEYVPRNVSSWWVDLFGGERAYNTSDLYGTGGYLSPGLVGLMVLTVMLGLRRRAELAVAAAIVLSLAALALYFFQDPRLLFPTLLIAVPFVGRESAAALLRAADRRVSSRLLAGLVVVLIVSSVIGYPSRDERLGLARIHDLQLFRGRSSYYRLVQELDRAAAGQPALVLAAFAPVYVAASSPIAHLVLPLSDVQALPPSLQADPGTQIRKALDMKQPVYLLIARDDAETRGRLSAPAGYGWTVVYTGNDARLEQLAPLASVDVSASGGVIAQAP